MNIAAIRAHAQAINDCNQRGGRMLSLVDLLDAESVDLPLAAYLAAAMRAGASLLVGARPGGAGKTAVMCALLNWIPDHTVIRPVDRPSVLEAGTRDACPQDVCYLAHEIGAGPYYAYIWGRSARAFFELAARGHIVASNLHADTLQETRDQLCRENRVPTAHLDAVTLKVYLRMERAGGWATRRWISQVYESDGKGNRLLWTGDNKGEFAQQAASDIVSPDQEVLYARFLAELSRRGIRHIDQVRQAVVEWGQAGELEASTSGSPDSIQSEKGEDKL
jgi:hypothetical protein